MADWKYLSLCLVGIFMLLQQPLQAQFHTPDPCKKSQSQLMDYFMDFPANSMPDMVYVSRVYDQCLQPTLISDLIFYYFNSLNTQYLRTGSGPGFADYFRLLRGKYTDLYSQEINHPNFVAEFASRYKRLSDNISPSGNTYATRGATMRVGSTRSSTYSSVIDDQLRPDPSPVYDTFNPYSDRNPRTRIVERTYDTDYDLFQPNSQAVTNTSLVSQYTTAPVIYSQTDPIPEKTTFSDDPRSAPNYTNSTYFDPGFNPLPSDQVAPASNPNYRSIPVRNNTLDLNTQSQRRATRQALKFEFKGERK